MQNIKCEFISHACHCEFAIFINLLLLLILSLFYHVYFLFKNILFYFFCFSGPFSIALLRTKVYHLSYLFVGKQNYIILHFFSGDFAAVSVDRLYKLVFKRALLFF